MITFGSRGSDLALTQTRMVGEALSRQTGLDHHGSTDEPPTFAQPIQHMASPLIGQGREHGGVGDKGGTKKGEHGREPRNDLHQAGHGCV